MILDHIFGDLSHHHHLCWRQTLRAAPKYSPNCKNVRSWLGVQFEPKMSLNPLLFDNSPFCSFALLREGGRVGQQQRLLGGERKPKCKVASGDSLAVWPRPLPPLPMASKTFGRQLPFIAVRGENYLKGPSDLCSVILSIFSEILGS